MATRYELAYPELFEPLTAARRASVTAALVSDQLEHGEVSRDQVALLIRSVTENMSDAEYLQAVLEHVAGSAATD